METHDIIDDLMDRMDWIAASVELQVATDEAATREVFARVAALQRRIEVRAREHEVPFRTLATRLALSETEQHVIALLAAMRSRPDVRDKICQVARSAELTLDAIRGIVHGALPSITGHTELSSSGTLRRLALIERNDDHGSHAHESKQTWSIASRVISLLHGDDRLDPELARLVRASVPRDLDALAVAPDAWRVARGAMTGRAVIVASGLEGLGRRTLLAATARAERRQVLEIDARRLSKDRALLVAQLRAVARECKLLARTPLIANLDALADEQESRIDLVGVELAGLIDGPVLVTTGVRRPRIDWDRPVIVVELEHPTSAQRAKLWQDELGCAPSDAALLATRYPLAPSMIVRAAEAAKARAGTRDMEAADISAGIRAVIDDRLGQFARRTSVTQTWKDVVLRQEQVDAVAELMARIDARRLVYEDWGFGPKVGKGLGTTALFSGPPGTGKTMVAAVIAKELELELYQVDLGKVVSKYIGETEKNLAALFDAAEAGHAILLFDEADSLFGKRTDVKSSNDRYANLETNYLLQRLESFTGICLLTSNHETNIDPAFLRRLSLHLRFDLPDVDERTHLWRAVIPKTAPVDPDIDFASLAQRFAMSGGYIRNAVLRAAFLAADEDRPITAAHLERAARVEYEGMGKLALSGAGIGRG